MNPLPNAACAEAGYKIMSLASRSGEFFFQFRHYSVPISLSSPLLKGRNTDRRMIEIFINQLY